MKTKTLTLKKTGYTITGTADLTAWGGGNACIEMAKFNVDKIDIKTLKENLNDNGFGVQSINGGICDIYENYEGTIRFLKTVEIGKISSHTREYHDNNYYSLDVAI
jgi:hypothetical protein